MMQPAKKPSKGARRSSAYRRRMRQKIRAEKRDASEGITKPLGNRKSEIRQRMWGKLIHNTSNNRRIAKLKQSLSNKAEKPREVSARVKIIDELERAEVDNREKLRDRQCSQETAAKEQFQLDSYRRALALSQKFGSIVEQIGDELPIWRLLQDHFAYGTVSSSEKAEEDALKALEAFRASQKPWFAP